MRACHIVRPEEEFFIGDMELPIAAYLLRCCDPVAYMMKQGKKTMAVLTDLGKYDDYLVDKPYGLMYYC